MADLRDSPEPAIESRFAIVEAFADGERVDPEALRAALADAAARDHFVDVVMMRDAVVSLEPAAFAAVAGTSPPPVHGRWLLAAAAGMVLSVAAGYVAGQRVVVPVSAAGGEVVLDVNDAPVAPAPTRSIVFEPGVNWTEVVKGR
jgi:hypothetical protein